MAETEERSLDNFFAKRDKKKKKERSNRAASAAGVAGGSSGAAGAASGNANSEGSCISHASAPAPPDGTTPSVLFLTGSWCVPQPGRGRSCCAVLQTQASKSIGVNSGFPWSAVATLGFALVQVKAQEPNIAC